MWWLKSWALTIKVFKSLAMQKTAVKKSSTGREAGWVENKRKRKQYYGQTVTKWNTVANRCRVKEARPLKTFSVLFQKIFLFLSSFSQYFLTPQFGFPILLCSSVVSGKISLSRVSQLLSCVSKYKPVPQFFFPNSSVVSGHKTVGYNSPEDEKSFRSVNSNLEVLQWIATIFYTTLHWDNV